MANTALDTSFFSEVEAELQRQMEPETHEVGSSPGTPKRWVFRIAAHVGLWPARLTSFYREIRIGLRATDNLSVSHAGQEICVEAGHVKIE